MYVWTCRERLDMLALCQSECWLASGPHFGLPVPSPAPPPRGDVQVLLAATLTVVQGAILIGSAAGAYSQASAGGLF